MQHVYTGYLSPGCYIQDTSHLVVGDDLIHLRGGAPSTLVEAADGAVRVLELGPCKEVDADRDPEEKEHLA